MIKKLLKRRMTIIILTLIVAGIIYIFPQNEAKYSFPIKTEYTENNKNYVFLMDNKEYIAMANVLLNNKETIELAKEIISILTINSDKTDYIPNGFKQIIPEDTKIIDISINEKILKINFSKELLNINEKYEEKMIEAIVFSLTSIKGVDKIMIFVEGERLLSLPHSNEILPLTLDRSYGINKVYNINSYKEVTSTIVYFVSKYNDNYYYVPVTLLNNDKKEKIEIIIDELKSSLSLEGNLMSYLKSNAELLDYEIKENEIDLSFNEFLLENFNEKEILEEVKYTISLSIKDNYNIENIVFFVNKEKITEQTIKNLEN